MELFCPSSVVLPHNFSRLFFATMLIHQLLKKGTPSVISVRNWDIKRIPYFLAGEWKEEDLSESPKTFCGRLWNWNCLTIGGWVRNRKELDFKSNVWAKIPDTIKVLTWNWTPNFTPIFTHNSQHWGFGQTLNSTLGDTTFALSFVVFGRFMVCRFAATLQPFPLPSGPELKLEEPRTDRVADTNRWQHLQAEFSSLIFCCSYFDVNAICKSHGETPADSNWED